MYHQLSAVPPGGSPQLQQQQQQLQYQHNKPPNDLHAGSRAGNHQLAGLGLAQNQLQQQPRPGMHHAHGARALAAMPTSGGSSFRPHDVPLQHSASRDVTGTLNLNTEPYSKDVVV